MEVRDDEIVKALERMSEEDPDGFSSDILGVINRLKAENERLRGPSRAYPFCNLIGGCLVFSKSLKDYNDMRKGLKSEAQKEFVERLIERATKTTWISGGELVEKEYKISREDLDNLRAEMEERE